MIIRVPIPLLHVPITITVSSSCSDGSSRGSSFIEVSARRVDGFEAYGAGGARAEGGAFGARGGG